MPNHLKKKLILEHEGEKYDVGKFLVYHPGGKNTLEAFKGKNITKKLEEFDHSASALYLMKEYKLNQNVRGNDDLESLVDWSKPMLSQVGNLGSKYQKWIQSPVDRKLRLFQYDLLEMMSVTPWYLIPIIWIPFSIIMVYIGITRNQQNLQGSSLVLCVLLTFACGAVLWTFIEYFVHRWVFHFRPPSSSPIMITFHFLLHGLHHKVPFDTTRLLFPPVPAGIIMLILYTIYSAIFPSWSVDFLAAGSVAGYVFYDLTHFYLHYGSPKPDTYMYHMKRYHNQHHFTQHQSGFGISSDFWDKVFGTTIFLKKLKWTLKW